MLNEQFYINNRKYGTWRVDGVPKCQNFDYIRNISMVPCLLSTRKKSHLIFKKLILLICFSEKKLAVTLGKSKSLIFIGKQSGLLSSYKSNNLEEKCPFHKC